MDLLHQFLSKIQNDASIDAHHIAIYTSLYFLWVNKKDEWLEVDKEAVMRLAKISSKATYYRKMSLLGERSYIGYQPSQANGVPTKVKMIKLEEDDAAGNNTGFGAVQKRITY